MSPRRYNTTRRAASAQATRARVLNAAREILLEQPALTMEAVAKRADVARMTLYYQFGSKRGLLEALFDDVGARALAPGLPHAMANPDPVQGLRELVSRFAAFWRSEAALIRRIRGLAVTDPDLEEGIRARDDRRRQQSRTFAERIAAQSGRSEAWLNDAADLIFAFTSFSLFDSLAAADGDANAERLVTEGLLRAIDLPSAN